MLDSSVVNLGHLESVSTKIVSIGDGWKCDTLSAWKFAALEVMKGTSLRTLAVGELEIGRAHV